MNNPLLQKKKLPPFEKIQVKHIEPALDFILQKNRTELKKLLQQKIFTWKNLILPLENIEDRLQQMWSPVGHLNSTMNSPSLRKTYNKCLPKLAEYHTEISHNKKLYEAILSIKNSSAYKKLNAIQKRIIENNLRDFKLAGVTLSAQKKKRFAKLQKQYSKLSAKFNENLLDATHAWFCRVTNKKQLSGLPEHVVTSAKQDAKKRKLSGWVLTLDFPIYYAVMTYADNRELRKKMYRAYVTKASDEKPSKKKYDNTKIMAELLSTRHELASLIEFKNFAEYSLATKMAKNPQEVITFLNDLAKRAKPFAKKEFRELTIFVKQNFKIKNLQAWDIAYYSEKLKKEKHSITEEELRPYLPENKVLVGMFKLAEKLFSIKIKERKTKHVWHRDVKYFELLGRGNKILGGFYVDLFARAHKRGGAWMDECRIRRKLTNNKIQIPVAYLNCNFSKPTRNKLSLLTHEEVCTLFHEFGHCLQHLLTKINYLEVSGINGVEWDAVELPSQFMENFCWQKEIIDLISEHYQTRKKLPGSLLKKLIASKNFQAGMQMMRQLELALFDFKLHKEFNPKQGAQIQKTLDAIRKKISVTPTVKFNRFQHGFSHIFGGGYAAGYYSYKWAEVLSSDAFAKFEKYGVLNKKVGKQFLQCILEQGGSQDAMVLFKKFRGRKPKINALLKHCGLKN
jgi:oligopeptidase A